MFQKEWCVLFVDDEADMLSISKLAIKDLEVFGLPTKVYTAASKEEAIELLKSNPDLRWNLAVAIIDVVMESDSAGLELCQHIREEMGDKFTQLFIRTGQPGAAPERKVIDDYDISGYFTKVEASDDKLYSIIKSGVRQYLWSSMSIASFWLLDNILSNSDSREKLIETLQFGLGGFGAPADIPRFVMVGDEVLLSIGLDEKIGNEMKDKLNGLDGKPLGGAGDKYVRDGYNNQLIKIGAQGSIPDVYFYFKTTFEPPEPIIIMYYRVFAGLGTAWPRAK